MSQVALGVASIPEWGSSAAERLYYLEQCMDLGITSLDNADIYGYWSTPQVSCEELFGEALALKPSLRNTLQIISKTSIIMPDTHGNEILYYNTTKEHILRQVEISLGKLRVDHIDLLLLHRPDPMCDAEGLSEAFDTLYDEGKVLNFGVSNYLPSQYDMLQSYLKHKLVTNEILLSVLHSEPFDNGMLDKAMEKRTPVLAYSPSGKGDIHSAVSGKALELKVELEKMAQEMGFDSIDPILYAWLYMHPVGVIPITGSSRISRVKTVVDALDITLEREQWYKILNISRGYPCI